jgi:acetylornithine deacetylase
MTAMPSSAAPHDTALELLARLVAFDTESQRSNLALVAFVEDYLAGWGVPFIRLPNADGDKAAILATIGPVGRPGVVLSGHTDVVPVAGQNWTSDPFTLRIENGKAYGRGAVDMKGFLALGLSLVPHFLKLKLKTPIHLFLSYDEETTCLGVLDGIARFGREMPMPLAVIVGEPTDLEVADAHKSVVTFNTTVTGFEAHSSKPFLGVNAITMAALLITELDRIDQEMMARGDTSGRFDPAYTTVHVGVLNGGNARNILARTCAFQWEFRGLPDLDPAEIPARLARYCDEVVLPRFANGFQGVGIETINNVSVPGLRPVAGSPAESLAMRLSGKNRTITVPYGTEAGYFQRGGAPTVVCGPGSINQAHQPDEYISLQALADGEAFMRRLGDWCEAN